MADPPNTVTRNDSGKSFDLRTGRMHVFRLRPLRVHWVEIEDVLFHFDSAVMMPDAEAEDEPGTPDQERISGLSALRAVLLHAGDNPEQKALIAGHTDTSGDPGYNEKLSKKRAANVLHVLLGEKDPWVAIARDHHKPDDVQHILRWVARWKGWPTDTVKAFQEEFSKPGNGYSIGVDGVVGKETWGAFFHLYQERLAELCLTDAAGLGTLRGNLHWLYGDKKLVGCGEYHPVDMPGKDGFKSQKNRRVEILFYDAGEEPLKKPSGDLCHKGGAGSADRCPIYNPQLYEYGRVVPKRLDVVSVDAQFAPGAETLEIAYQIEGLASEAVILEVVSPHYAKGPIFKRELSGAEKSDGAHTIAWDGKANCPEGDLKDAFIHPLYSPYKVRISDGKKHQDEASFKVLYHSLALCKGPWTPDEAEPVDQKEWVQFKLNQLGYYGGPVGKDTDGYLRRAIIRYKANHKKLHQLDYSKYDDSITGELTDALLKNENARPFFEEAALADRTKESRIFVEALTYESKAEFGQSKAVKEKDRLNRPLIPLEVEIFLRGKGGQKVKAPRGVGPVRVNWRFTDEDEDLAPQFAPQPGAPSQTRKYVEKALKLRSGRAGNGDNCHKDFGGIREDPATNWATPALVGDFYVPHVVEKDGGQKVLSSKACVDAKHPKRAGRAGLYFRPSTIGGDDYRIRAELDFTGLPNKDELEGVHGVTDEASRIHVESGRFRIWRTAKIAMRVTWPARTNSNQWAEIVAEYEKAFLKVDLGGPLTRKITDLMTAGQYKQIVADNTSHKKKDVTFHHDAIVGVKLPGQGSMNAAQYRTALKTFTSDEYWRKIMYVIREQLSKNVRKDHPTGFVITEFLTHKPVAIRKSPPGNNTVVDPAYVTWSVSIGMPDSVVFADQKDPDKVYYVVAHEMGHNLWLKHWQHAGGSQPTDHDTADTNCIMSYSDSSCGHPHHAPGTYAPHFCGQCNLKLRGWDIDHANIPADST